ELGKRMNRRRKLLVALGAGALVAPLTAAPLTSFAQQKTHRVAVLSAGTRASTATSVEAFIAGLRDLGYVEGKNVPIEPRYADGNLERLPLLAAELVQWKPDLILALGS